MVDEREAGAAGDGEEEGGGDVPWREILRDLQLGKEVEIPVSGQQDLGKKRRQVTRRAERHGMAVEVTAGDGLIRVRRTGEAVADPEAETSDRERRERRRAERQGNTAGA